MPTQQYKACNCLVTLRAQEEATAPAAFAPVVRAFAGAPQLAVRHLAARALAPLVAPEERCATLADLLGCLPAAPPITNHNEVRASPHSVLALCCVAPRAVQVF